MQDVPWLWPMLDLVSAMERNTVIPQTSDFHLNFHYWYQCERCNIPVQNKGAPKSMLLLATFLAITFGSVSRMILHKIWRHEVWKKGKEQEKTMMNLTNI